MLVKGDAYFHVTMFLAIQSQVIDFLGY